MTIARLKYAAIAAVCMAGASAQADTVLLNEGFESFASLAGSGWVMTNASTPVGSTGFGAGFPAAFSAQAGSAASYISGNYNNAAAGGSISNWLITPTFSTATDVVVSFWVRGAVEDPYFDQFAYGFSSTGGSAIGSFTLGATSTALGDWTQYTASIAGQGAGSTARFAIVYTGAADSSNFIGIDSVSIAAVPEPSTWLLFGAGLVGLTGLARRRLQAQR